MQKTYLLLLCLLCNQITTNITCSNELPPIGNSARPFHSPKLTKGQRLEVIKEVSDDEILQDADIDVYSNKQIAKLSQIERDILYTYENEMHCSMNIAQLIESPKHLVNPAEVIAKKEELKLLTAFIQIQHNQRSLLLTNIKKYNEKIISRLNRELINKQLEIVQKLLEESNNEFFKNLKMS